MLSVQLYNIIQPTVHLSSIIGFYLSALNLHLKCVVPLKQKEKPLGDNKRYKRFQYVAAFPPKSKPAFRNQVGKSMQILPSSILFFSCCSLFVYCVHCCYLGPDNKNRIEGVCTYFFLYMYIYNVQVLFLKNIFYEFFLEVIFIGKTGDQCWPVYLVFTRTQTILFLCVKKQNTVCCPLTSKAHQPNSSHLFVCWFLVISLGV